MSRILRERQSAIDDQLGMITSEPEEGAASFLAKTFAESVYPTTASAVYALHPCELDVAEAEGATGTPAADSSVTIYALNLGTAIPASGTVVIVDSVGGRNVFRYD